VHDRHADVHDDVLSGRMLQKGAQHLPRMQQGVALVKVVLATVAAEMQKIRELRNASNFARAFSPDFEFGAAAEPGAARFGLLDAADDLPGVALEVHGPLVEGAHGHLCPPTHLCVRPTQVTQLS